MKRKQALTYVGHALDDALDVRTERGKDIPANARLIGWQCGFEPMFVAVWSYLPDITMGAQEAEDIATAYLEEIKWFSGEPWTPDYVV